MVIVKGTIVYDDKKNEYKVNEMLDTGGFSSIYKIQNINTNEIYILKTFSSGFNNQNELNSFINEINNAKVISHPNVIQYYFFNDGKIYKDLPPYLIMEYADGGNLKKYINDRIRNKEYISNIELNKIYKQLVNGMKAISEKVVHRDIKPENILIKNNILKISDFGIGKLCNQSTREYNTFKGYGSEGYIAPEAWRLEKNTIQMDIYSMGIVFYELATLEYPYLLDNSLDRMESYKNAHLFKNIKNPLSINKDLSPVYANLISKMLEKSTDKRFKNWDEILQILNNQDNLEQDDDNLINQMLKKRYFKDEKIRKEEIEATRKAIKVKEDDELVEYSFIDNIYNPIKNYVDKFNEKYPQGEIKMIKRRTI